VEDRVRRTTEKKARMDQVYLEAGRRVFRDFGCGKMFCGGVVFLLGFLSFWCVS
jgi:hypothetical protein